ncbi:MAG: hypothetical protein D3925_15225 [Candidatus Electrothrix sp. AR5]|nr:hypothetical protein [Candidatus Electrothrix sp. AR5]
MTRIRKGKKRNTPKRGVLSNYNYTPIGKKGGANLPRHRVELYINQKAGCKTRPDRKKKEE